MKTALVIGGTGLVGSVLIKLLLEDERYAKIVLLARNPIELAHKKLMQEHFDFSSPKESLVAGDELFCCLGTTMKKAGSKAAFYKVDHDYIIETAHSAFRNGVKKFGMISSMGANKKSLFFYNRVKGKTEEDATKIGIESLFIFRPSLLLGDRPGKRAGESIAAFPMKITRFLVPKNYQAINAREVASAMIHKMNSGEKGIHIIESGAMQLQTAYPDA